jgi:hypothetical protein
MSYQTAFPDFTLDVTIPDGFRDDSYKNDAMPRFTRELPHGQTLTLWIDYADRALSEYPEGERFLVELLSFDGDYVEQVASDNWQDILDFIAEY